MDYETGARLDAIIERLDAISERLDTVVKALEYLCNKTEVKKDDIVHGKE